MKQIKFDRLAGDVNIFLKAIFKDAVFEIASENENSYKFRLSIDPPFGEVNGFIHKEEFHAHSTRLMFEWLDMAVKNSWKHRNMEWI